MSKKPVSLRNFGKNRDGAAIIEFGMFVPILIGVLGAIVDIGSAVHTRFLLSNEVANASNYALANAGKTNSSSGASLASSIATIVASAVAPDWSDATIVVNNGPTTQIKTVIQTVNGIQTPVTTTINGGTASNADACYCPTLTNGALAWGSSMTCGSTCPNGGTAGKFVSVTASRTLTTLFVNSTYLAPLLQRTSVIQVQ